jgi:hypothetical protein
MANDNYCSPILVDVTFSGNAVSGASAAYGGGMDDYQISSPILTNVTFTGNTLSGGSGSKGGGICHHDATLTIYHGSFYGNDESAITNDATMNVYNSAFYDNNSGNDVNGSGTHNVTYSCSQENLSGLDASNQTLPSTPFDIGPGGELFLIQNPANPCIDNGNVDDANTAYGDFEWNLMTTAPDNALDTDTVDMGTHYPVLD